MRAALRSRLACALVLGLVPIVPGESAAQQPAAATPDNCRTCHEVLGDERLAGPAERFPGDVHAQRGMGCIACHGGDATTPGLEAMDPAKGFLGAPERRQVSQFCGRCHSDAQFMRRFNPALRVDQEAEYATSVHGQRLATYGDTAVATCLGCHPAHSIKPPNDPESSVHPLNVAGTCAACHADANRMEPYGISTDQREKYERSVHWEMMSVEGDLSAPTCNDCHGNHGAAPPGVQWVGNVCGQCHVVMGALFSRSRHAVMFAAMGQPGCATCHNNHEIVPPGDNLLGLGEGAVCARCHVEGVGGGIAAAEMRALIDSLKTTYDTAHALLDRAENAGMEVSQAQFELSGAQTELVLARAALHAFVVDSVRHHIETGLETSRTAYAQGVEALGELRFRRLGLAVSVTIIIAFVAGLLLKIRELERRPFTT